jgi:hypothetical protein
MRATCIDLATYDTQGLLIPPCPFSSLVGFLVSFFVLYPCKVPRGLQSDNGIQQLSTSPAMHYRVDFETRCIYMRACYLDTFTLIICSITQSSGTCIFSGTLERFQFLDVRVGATLQVQR